MDLFNFDDVDYRITKPVRMITLFSGYDSQCLAMKYIGVPYEHYFACEFDKYAIKSLNEIHGTDFQVSDITKVKGVDLNIKETDKYCYFMTYSFPCT